MGIRFLTGAVLVIVIAPVVFFAPNWAVSILLAFFAGTAAFEMTGCVGHRSEWWLTGSTVALCAAGAGLHGGMIQDADASLSVLFESLFVVCILLMTLLYGLASVVRHEQFPVSDSMAQYGLCLYLLLGFSALCRLVVTPHRILLVAAMVIPWVADALAYFSGRLFGKRKLCPVISPKKTVEGAVGGVLGTAVIAVVLFAVFMKNRSVPALLVVFAAAAVLAVFSIFGDLFASVVKRHYGIKDYGKLLPGHGGVMDRFDSVLPVSMVLFLLSLIPYFSELLL